MNIDNLSIDLIKEKKINVVIPILNESIYLESLIKSIEKMDISDLNISFFFVDGCSKDNSVKILNEKLKKSNLDYRILINENKTVPYALNKVIKEFESDFLIRLDAHCEFPKNYIKKCLLNSNLDYAGNVGGMLINLPADNSLKAKCIALSMGSVFGVGQSKMRTLFNSKKIIEVDTVPFGTFNTDIFKKIGLFDYDLTRNQDDEFNARIIKFGKKIYLDPSLKIKYFCRSNFSDLAKMFYQYGLFKPLGAFKVKRLYTFRQIVPISILFLFMILLSFSFLDNKYLIILIFFIVTYLLISLLESLRIMTLKKFSLKGIFFLMSSFFIMHSSYALGYLKGLIKIILKINHNINVNESR